MEQCLTKKVIKLLSVRNLEMERTTTRYYDKDLCAIVEVLHFLRQYLLAKNLFSTPIMKTCDFLTVNINLPQDVPNE